MLLLLRLLACENIRFSLLFADGDVSRGGTRETSPSAKSEEKWMFSQASYDFAFSETSNEEFSNTCIGKPVVFEHVL